MKVAVLLLALCASAVIADEILTINGNDHLIKTDELMSQDEINHIKDFATKMMGGSVGDGSSGGTGVTCGLDNINLASMESTTTDIKGTDGQYTYYMNVCGSVVNQVCSSAKPGVSICQTDGNQNTYSLGYYSQGVQWSAIPQGSSGTGVIMTYTNGDQCGQPYQPTRTTNVLFVCADETDSSFQVQTPQQGSTDCTFNIPIRAQAACPPGSGGGKKKGLSGGWIFIIILCVLLPVYIVAGCIYKRQKLGATGIEACPNVDFWKDLPGLVRDGFRFTFGKISSLCGGGSKTGFDEL